MFLVFSVETVALGVISSMSAMSLFAFLMSAGVTELQILNLLINLACCVMCVTFLWHSFPAIETTLEKLHGETDASLVDAATGETTSYFVERQTTEQRDDGKIIITTVYVPTSRTSNSNDEVREMIEKTPPLPSPNQETAEFHDLIAVSAKKDN